MSIVRKYSIWASFLVLVWTLSCTRETGRIQLTTTSNTPDASITVRSTTPIDIDTETAATSVVQVPVELTPTPKLELDDPEFGYSLCYPVGWQVEDQVVATEFAQDARCTSVEVVDLYPPPEADAVVLHSFVQICATSLRDSLSLEEYMRHTYGGEFRQQFEFTSLGGLAAFKSVAEDQDATWYVQTDDHRFQIVSAVVAEPDKKTLRDNQVQAIIDSLQIESSSNG